MQQALPCTLQRAALLRTATPHLLLSSKRYWAVIRAAGSTLVSLGTVMHGCASVVVLTQLCAPMLYPMVLEMLLALLYLCHRAVVFVANTELGFLTVSYS